jgi:hypothetical protein
MQGNLESRSQIPTSGLPSLSSECRFGTPEVRSVVPQVDDCAAEVREALSLEPAHDARGRPPIG